jgi:transcriptional regulator with GAF, ATPase, and Fis domain
LQVFLAGTRSNHCKGSPRLQLADAGRSVQAVASVFRQDDDFFALVHLTELVCNVPLKGAVSETTVLIGQWCIGTALQMTGDKRASAALLLGLSRQSLYMKPRRFGIAADQAADDD